MFCSKCGSQIDSNERFCKGCGTLVAQTNNNQTVQQPIDQNNVQNSGQPINNTINPMNNQQVQQPMGQGINMNNSSNLSQQYVDNALNPNMKKWAILSIVIPAVAIVWYFFIGLSFWLALIIASAGLSFAKKGEFADKKLALAGKILNYCLIGLGVVMLILMLIANFAN